MTQITQYTQSQIDEITIHDESNDRASLQSQIDHIMMSDYSNDLAPLQPQIDIIIIQDIQMKQLVYNLELIGKGSKMTQIK